MLVGSLRGIQNTSIVELGHSYKEVTELSKPDVVDTVNSKTPLLLCKVRMTCTNSLLNEIQTP